MPLSGTVSSCLPVTRLLFGIAVLVAGVLFVPVGRAEDPDPSRWRLPEGALARFGKGYVRSVTYSPNGDWLAVVGTIGIWIYDTRTATESALLTGHQARVTSVSLSPDGQTLATGRVDNTVRLWDVASGQEKAVLRGHTEVVLSVAFSPDGFTLASGSGDRTARLWDVAGGQEKAILESRSSQARFVAFSPDGFTLASTDKWGDIQLWDVGSGLEQATLTGHSGEVLSVAFSREGQTLATVNKHNTVRLWDVASGQQLAPPKVHRSEVISAAISPDGQTLASSGLHDNSIQLWDVASGQMKAALDRHMRWVRSVAFSSDGQTLASGHFGSIHLWDVASGQVRITLDGQTRKPWSVAFSPDGRILASGSYVDEKILLWDVTSGQQTATLEGHTSGVGSVAFSSDGQTLASGGYGPILLWDVARAQEKATLDGPYYGGTASVAISPDGQTLASAAGNETILLWEVTSGQQMAALEGDSDVVPVAFSPDGLTLASGSWDGAILLWDVAGGQVKTTLEGHTDAEAGNLRLVLSVAFSPDGLSLASCGRDGTVRVWDVASGQQKALFEGHAHYVESVAFSPDGQILASGGVDGTILLWDLLPPEVQVSLRAAADTVAEGEAVEVTVSLSRDPKRTLTVPVRGTPHSQQGAYSGVPVSLTFTSGQTERTFVVTAIDDEEDERTRRLTLGFGSLPGRVILGTPAHWVLTVIDDDPPRSHRMELEARVLGDAVKGLIVEFSRSISGRPRSYAWSDTADANGRVTLTITTETRASGFYQARARTGNGEEVGSWHSIPLNGNRRQVLELPLGGNPRVVSVESMAAAKEAGASVAPTTGSLKSNYPNPFNNRTQIAYRLALSGWVQLSIYNVLGQPVRTLVDRFQAAGSYQASWDALDQKGAPVAAGVYLVRLQYPGGGQTRRLLYLR